MSSTAPQPTSSAEEERIWAQIHALKAQTDALLRDWKAIQALYNLPTGLPLSLLN